MKTLKALLCALGICIAILSTFTAQAGDGEGGGGGHGGGGPKKRSELVSNK